MNLSPFRSRVRLLTTLRSMLIGLLAGGVVALIFSGLMFTKLISLDARILVGSVVGGALIGLFRGLLLRVGESELLRSIDRRAELEDRLTTSQEVKEDSEFAQLLAQDANAHFSSLNPKAVFPMRWYRRDALVALPVLAAAGLFFFASLPVNLTPEQRLEKAAMKRAAVEVEHLSSPLKDPERSGSLTPEEKRLAQELNQLQQKLQNASIEKESALQKMNELGRDAEKESLTRGEQAMDKLEDAQESLTKAAISEMDKYGASMSAADLKAMHAEQEERASQRNELRKEEKSLRQQLAEIKKKLENDRLSDEERKELTKRQESLEKSLRANQEEQKQLQNKLDAMNQSAQEMKESRETLEGQQSTLENQISTAEQKLSQVQKQLQNKNLSPEQRKALEEAQRKLQEALKGLEKELAEVQKAIQELMNNEKIREMMDKLNNHPEMAKLRKMMEEMQQNAEAQENGEAPTLTKEDLEAMKQQIEEMKAELEELADQLKDPQALEDYIKALEEAIKNQEMGAGLGMMGLGLPGLLGMMGMPGMPMGSSSYLPEDVMSVDTQKVNHSDRDKQINAKISTGAAKGQRSENGTESYIEVRGPTSVGNRTSVPYTKVLPSYRQRAEQALKNRKIPKQHEKRVKAYFDSLTGNK